MLSFFRNFASVMEKRQMIFHRAGLLIGQEAMHRLQAARVILFGVGGVGSWCAECLVRSGVGHLTIVDADRVCVTNVNRQLMATTATVGQVKVEAMRDRLLTINPEAEVTAVHQVFDETTAGSFRLDTYDYIIDAIDSLKDKALLILMACQTRARLFSSMGAALKLDPTRIQVAEFWKVQGDPLARALRNRFKRQKTFPKHKFLCVYSDELLANRGQEDICGTSCRLCVKGFQTEQEDAASVPAKTQVNGSLAHITAIFGMTLAGLVVQSAVHDDVNGGEPSHA